MEVLEPGLCGKPRGLVVEEGPMIELNGSISTTGLSRVLGKGSDPSGCAGSVPGVDESTEGGKTGNCGD